MGFERPLYGRAQFLGGAVFELRRWLAVGAVLVQTHVCTQQSGGGSHIMPKAPGQHPDSLPANPLYQGPFGGDVSQWIRTLWFPWSDFLKSTTGEKQVGLINVMVDEMESGNAERERKIVTGVASYGKQLDRISDALNAMIGLMLSQRSVSELSQDDRKAFDEFSEMFKQIAEAKGEHITPTEANLELYLENIRDLKERDPNAYKSMLKRLRQFTKSERSE